MCRIRKHVILFLAVLLLNKDPTKVHLSQNRKLPEIVNDTPFTFMPCLVYVSVCIVFFFFLIPLSSLLLSKRKSAEEGRKWPQRSCSRDPSLFEKSCHSSSPLDWAALTKITVWERDGIRWESCKRPLPTNIYSLLNDVLRNSIKLRRNDTSYTYKSHGFCFFVVWKKTRRMNGARERKICIGPSSTPFLMWNIYYPGYKWAERGGNIVKFGQETFFPPKDEASTWS